MAIKRKGGGNKNNLITELKSPGSMNRPILFLKILLTTSQIKTHEISWRFLIDKNNAMPETISSHKGERIFLKLIKLFPINHIIDLKIIKSLYASEL